MVKHWSERSDCLLGSQQGALKPNDPPLLHSHRTLKMHWLSDDGSSASKCVSTKQSIDTNEVSVTTEKRARKANKINRNNDDVGCGISFRQSVLRLSGIKPFLYCKKTGESPEASRAISGGHDQTGPDRAGPSMDETPLVKPIKDAIELVSCIF